MSLETFGSTTREWCALAAQILGWRPADFWAATPRELAAALSDPRQSQTTAPPSRELIETLMERDANG